MQAAQSERLLDETLLRSLLVMLAAQGVALPVGIELRVFLESLCCLVAMSECLNHSVVVGR